MEIEKLKKQLLREELRRRRKNSRRPLAIAAAIGCAALLLGGWIYYRATLDERLAGRFAEAEAMVARGDYDQAMGTYHRIHENHPGFRLASDALLRYGEILNLFHQRYHEAILAYLLVEKDYPSSEAALKAKRRVAEIYKNRLGDYSQAIIAYQKLVDDGAQDGDAMQYEVADCYFRLNNFEQSRIEFDSLLKQFPESPLIPEARYRLAQIYALEGESQKAEEAFRTVAETWPESPYALEARFGLAAVLEERDELRAALALLEELEGAYPNGEVLDRKIEQVKERIGKKKKAI